MIAIAILACSLPSAYLFKNQLLLDCGISIEILPFMKIRETPRKHLLTFKGCEAARAAKRLHETGKLVLFDLDQVVWITIILMYVKLFLLR